MKQIHRLAMPALFLGLLLLAVSWLSGEGLDTAAADTHQIVEIVPNELETSTHVGNMYLSDVTGAPLVLYGVNYPVTAASPRAMAEQYLRENAALLRLQAADLNDLEYNFLRQGPAGTTVRFQQVVNGIPVYKSVIAVHINHHNQITYVTNDYKSNLTLNRFEATLSSASARQAALNYLGIEGNLLVDKTEPIIYHLQGQTHLAYLVRLMAPTLLGDWEIIVDAHTGEFLKVFDTSYSFSGEEEHDHGQPPLQASILVTGTGTVFDPDPLSSAQATYGATGYVDGSDANTPQLNAQLMTVNLLDIEFAGGVYTLKGPYAEIRDFDAPFKGLFTQPTSTFNYNRFDDAFEAVNTYYHIDSSMRYLNETLGLNILPYQYVGGVRYDPHGVNGDDNSYYTSALGAVSFGEGGVDDAEDSDVIHHELGHGLHDWVTNGGLSQVNGLSEGTGDYWAQSYNRSLGNWAPSDPQYHWVFNWDGHNPFWGGRRTNHPNLYPGGLTGSIHTDGQIWATCNMRVYDAIGKVKLDTAFWEGLGMTSSSTNQEQAAQAVYQAAIDMGYSTADLQAMYNIYITCVYNVPPVPTVEIVVNPTSLSSSQAPHVQVVETLTISNTGTVALDWQIEEANTVTQLDNQFASRAGAANCAAPSDIPWASVNPTSGTVPTMSADTVAVTFNSTSYAPGVYTGTLCIASNDVTNPLVTVPLTMTVVPNTPPVAMANAYATTQDTPLIVNAPGVLGNDSDVDGQGLTAVLDTTVSQGTLSFNADGSFVYTPTAGFQGEDSFTYTADDGLDSSNVATVTITVENTAPVAVADDYSIGRNGVLTVTAPGILDNDSDVDGQGLTAVLDTTVANGTLALSADGSFIYTPTLGFVGEDSFTYTADDGVDSSNVVTVTITVLNTAPVATADSYTATQDSVLTVAQPGVLGNDSDGDGDGLTAVLITDVANGTLVLSADGSFIYTPTAGFTGSDSFTYSADDGVADSNVVTVTIEVVAAPASQPKIFLPFVVKN